MAVGLRKLLRLSLSTTHMTSVDPSYPLYPTATIVAAATLLLVLSTSFVRQIWNLGVAFLCFWLFWENLTLGVNSIIWADNADVKLNAYCEIGEYSTLDLCF